MATVPAVLGIGGGVDTNVTAGREAGPARAHAAHAAHPSGASQSSSSASTDAAQASNSAESRCTIPKLEVEEGKAGRAAKGDQS